MFEVEVPSSYLEYSQYCDLLSEFCDRIEMDRVNMFETGRD